MEESKPLHLNIIEILRALAQANPNAGGLKNRFLSLTEPLLGAVIPSHHDELRDAYLAVAKRLGLDENQERIKATLAHIEAEKKARRKAAA